MKLISNKYFLTVVGVGLLFLIWYILFLVTGQSIYTFPDPGSVLVKSFELFGKPYLYKCIWGSLYRMLIGFGVASILGILLGMVVGNFTKLKHVFNPTMIALRSIPTAALVFLILRLVGFKNASIYIVMVIVFPMVYEATVSGYQNVDVEIRNSMRIDSPNAFANNFRVLLPLSMPYIAVGLTSSFALSFKIEIMAEVLTSSSDFYGLGSAISIAYADQSDGLVSTFAYSFIAILIMMLVTLIIYIIKRLLKIKNPTAE